MISTRWCSRTPWFPTTTCSGKSTAPGGRRRASLPMREADRSASSKRSTFWSRSSARLARSPIGEAPKGWAVERFLETFYVLVALVRALGPQPDRRSAEGLGRLVAQLHTLRRMSVSVAGMLQAGKEPVVEGSIVKDLGTAWEQKLPARVRELAAF